MHYILLLCPGDPHTHPGRASHAACPLTDSQAGPLFCASATDAQSVSAMTPKMNFFMLLLRFLLLPLPHETPGPHLPRPNSSTLRTPTPHTQSATPLPCTYPSRRAADCTSEWAETADIHALRHVRRPSPRRNTDNPHSSRASMPCHTPSIFTTTPGGASMVIVTTCSSGLGSGSGSGGTGAISLPAITSAIA